MFQPMFKPSEICNFIQGNGAFHLVACRYGFWERENDNVSKNDVKPCDIVKEVACKKKTPTPNFSVFYSAHCSFAALSMVFECTRQLFILKKL